MTAIQANSAGVKDMADGSLRITFEFDPRYAKEAYTLFGARGTSCAIAALTQESTIKAAQVEVQERKTKAGELCIMACNFCSDAYFCEWVGEISGFSNAATVDFAKHYVIDACGISSRKELDTNTDAANKFHAEIRKPFLDWKNNER